MAIDTLQNEGYTMINNKNLKTYFAHNGSSAIDLVFYRGKNITVESQDGIWSSTASPIWKHIPIKTIINSSTPKQKLKKTNNTSKTKISRKIDATIIEQNREDLDRALQFLAEGKTNEALETTNNLLRAASIPLKQDGGNDGSISNVTTAGKKHYRPLGKAKTREKKRT